MIALTLETFAPAPMGNTYPPLVTKGKIYFQKKYKEDIEISPVQRWNLLNQNKRR